jgi:formiminotetrahydrofolate cyclodeaminase
MSARPSSPDGYFALSLEDLLAEVASPQPVPGGGFVAAVSVAMAAGLVTMAARLSSDWPEARGAAAQAETLRARARELARRNAEAYSQALAALGGEEEKYRTRDETLADALDRAADVPLQIGDAAAAVTTLAAEVADRGEPSVRADCAVAASLATAGARAAASLVEVNLATTGDDERVVRARAQVADAEGSLERALAAVA